jgi:hypothetical protein
MVETNVLAKALSSKCTEVSDTLGSFDTILGKEVREIHLNKLAYLFHF